MKKLETKYICYTLTIEKERRYELETFFNQVFFDTNYEIISDVEEEEINDDFGELYEDAITEYTNFSIRFYVTANMQSATTKRVKKAPKGTFIEKYSIDYSKEDTLNAYKQKINLTDNCEIVFENNDIKADANNIQIILPPKNAFGTGSHSSTQLAAKLLEKTFNKHDILLDVGTGTGILAIYAAKLGIKKILAIDSDKDAIKEAQQALQENNVMNSITLQQNNFIENINLQDYTKIVANLSLNLYEPFLSMMKDTILKKQRFIFSGIQMKEKSIFENILIQYNFEVEDCIEENEWIAYYVRKI